MRRFWRLLKLLPPPSLQPCRQLQHDPTRPLPFLRASPFSSLSVARPFSVTPNGTSNWTFARPGVSNSPSLHPPMQQHQKRTYASKLKKYKIKAYSSYKGRFVEKASGEYKRWRSGKRHNAHSKTPKQRRQLRVPSVVPPAYAKVMKKLNFHG